MAHPLRWTALVALEQPELPARERIAERWAELNPVSPALAATASTENLHTFTLGDFTAAATLVPRPIPAAQLEGPAEAAWYWPDAAASLQRQTAHLLVTLIDDGGPAIEKALALTRLTAALTSAAPSVGVFWGPGRLVHPAAAFVEQAATAGAQNLPLFLWVDFRVEPLGDSPADGVRLFTTGLEALGGAEVEVPHYAGDPQQLVGFVYNLAHYQLKRRKMIRDGDTIGLADGVQATAHRGPSLLGGELEVIRLEID